MNRVFVGMVCPLIVALILVNESPTAQAQCLLRRRQANQNRRPRSITAT